MKRKLMIAATVIAIIASANSFGDEWGVREECRVYAPEIRVALDKKGFAGSEVIGCMIAGRTNDTVKFGLAMQTDGKSIYQNATYTTVTIKTGK